MTGVTLNDIEYLQKELASYHSRHGKIDGIESCTDAICLQAKAGIELLKKHIEAVPARAYELYVARGKVDGFELDDWVQAEREILWSVPRAQSVAAGSDGESTHVSAPRRLPSGVPLYSSSVGEKLG